jgi:glycine betaine catabolism B
MNTNNKASKQPWVIRLFEQSGAIVSEYGKTYYTHHYPDHTPDTHSPLSALFSSTEKNQAEVMAATHNSHYSESSLPSVNTLSTLFQPNNAQRNVTDNPSSFQLTVVNSYDETPDTKTFHLTGQMLPYLPGQYITLSIVINGQAYKRSYSLASSPSRPQVLEITIKRAPNNGIVSNWLNDNLQIGDSITAKGPYGKFSCASTRPKKILFIAAGSGIVPIMSMLRWLTDIDASVDVQVLLSFRSPKDIIYRDELALMVARHKNVNVAITLTSDDIAHYDWPGLSGRIDENMIQLLIPDLAERSVYLCGPDAFMTACKKDLIKLQLPPEKIFYESFSVNGASTNIENSAVISTIKTSVRTHQVRFAKSGKSITADGQMSILELAEHSGITIHSDCRSGSCGECIVKCKKGRVKMTDQVEIDDKDRKKGWVYSCCAYPASNVVLDI